MLKPEKTRLPGFLVADLYRNNLVIIDHGGQNVETTASEPAEERQWWLGSNLQKITLIVNEQDAVFVNESSLQFLSAILGACKRNLGDVAIVNRHNQAVSYPTIKATLEPRCLLLFGVTAQEAGLPFAIPHYQVQQYDGCSILLAPALSAMLGETQEAKLEKSKLWLCLKKIFNL
jgi:hypothetical protein